MSPTRVTFCLNAFYNSLNTSINPQQYRFARITNKCVQLLHKTGRHHWAPITLTDFENPLIISGNTFMTMQNNAAPVGVPVSAVQAV